MATATARQVSRATTVRRGRVSMVGYRLGASGRRAARRVMVVWRCAPERAPTRHPSMVAMTALRRWRRRANATRRPVWMRSCSSMAATLRGASGPRAPTPAQATRVASSLGRSPGRGRALTQRLGPWAGTARRKVWALRRRSGSATPSTVPLRWRFARAARTTRPRSNRRLSAAVMVAACARPWAAWLTMRLALCFASATVVGMVLPAVATMLRKPRRRTHAWRSPPR
mmetsp:Transcript_3233/g.10102  ORF Transcript_3233/g.10102 Transcript_3233/m.10102 type:complete len:228 (+) Transcript_3233:3032-3715(+)